MSVNFEVRTNKFFVVNISEESSPKRVAEILHSNVWLNENVCLVWQTVVLLLCITFLGFVISAGCVS